MARRVFFLVSSHRAWSLPSHNSQGLKTSPSAFVAGELGAWRPAHGKRLCLPGWRKNSCKGGRKPTGLFRDTEHNVGLFTEGAGPSIYNLVGRFLFCLVSKRRKLSAVAPQEPPTKVLLTGDQGQEPREILDLPQALGSCSFLHL